MVEVSFVDYVKLFVFENFCVCKILTKTNLCLWVRKVGRILVETFVRGKIGTKRVRDCRSRCFHLYVKVFSQRKK